MLAVNFHFLPFNFVTPFVVQFNIGPCESPGRLATPSFEATLTFFPFLATFDFDSLPAVDAA